MLETLASRVDLSADDGRGRGIAFAQYKILKAYAAVYVELEVNDAAEIVLHRAVLVGDVVCCYADIQKVGTTSITIGVEAWVLRPQELKDHFKVTEGVFTFVALDETGKKCPVLPE